LSPEELDYLIQLMDDAFSGGAWKLAKEIFEEAIPRMEIEEILLVFFQFDERQRAFLKDAERKYLEEFWRI
jgi:hypothetical protein